MPPTYSHFAHSEIRTHSRSRKPDVSARHQLQLAIAAHNRWKSSLTARINAALLGEQTLLGAGEHAQQNGAPPASWQQDGNASLCLLGEWLQSYRPMASESWHYRRVQDLHELLHAEAARISALLAHGQALEAKAALSFHSSFSTQFGRLIDALTAWRASIA